MRQLLCFIFILFFITLTGQIEAQVVDNPPPIDSLCMVWTGISFLGPWNSPQNYPNAKHITNVVVGSYYFPVVIWETGGGTWHYQSLFCYWDEYFGIWSYPDSFTTGGGEDTGRGNVCADSKGNLHFAWHQDGNPDGYEVFYTKAVIDTTAGLVTYTVERPAVMLSATNGEEETYPAMTIYDDTLIMVVFNVGDYGSEHAIAYNYSKDGGDTWFGREVAYEHGAPMQGSLVFPSIASDPTTGDMWVAVSFEETGNYSDDIIAFHYDIVSGSWTKEAAAISPYYEYRYYSLPVICVDFSGIPSICFLNNREFMFPPPPYLWYRNGILLFTRRETTGWSSPVEVGLPENGPTNAISGFPSIGITQNNEVYIACTQPEGASSDTSPYYPLNVYYWKIDPELGIFSVPRTKVSEITSGSNINANFPHILYDITIGSSDEPAITWCQMENDCFPVPPADIYYKCLHQLACIEQTDNQESEIQNSKLTVSPNPFSTKTEITFSIGHPDRRTHSSYGTGSAEGIEIGIYDVCGRLVKSFSLPTTNSILPTVITWDGKDNSGREVPAGLYFVSGRIGGIPVNEKFVCVR